MFETEVNYKGYCDQCKQRHQYITRLLLSPEGTSSICKQCDSEIEEVSVGRSNWEDATLDGEE